MTKRIAIVLAGLLAALCSACALPLRDAGDGVYYAESPPDYVYADYGPFSWSFYGWLGTPYDAWAPYSSWYTHGNHWQHPPYGIPYAWATSRYVWHPPRAYPVTPAVVNGGKLSGKPPQARYAKAYPAPPAARQGKVRPEPAAGAASKASPRSAYSPRSMSKTPAPRSRPMRKSRSMTAPKSLRAPASRKID